MGQLTIYLPDPVEARIRREARRTNKSVSAYIASLGAEVPRGAHGWPRGFEQLFGSLHGELSAPPDQTPEAPPLGTALPARHKRGRRVPRRR